jgi:sulfatase modifying factor 1
MKKWFPLLLVIMYLGFISISCSDDSSTESTDNDPIPGEMVFVQGGTFEMGDHFSEGVDIDLPVHSVTVSDFYIGKYEVTQSEWATHMSLETNASYGVGDNYPVYYISWYKILVYCNKRSIAEGIIPCYTISASTNPDDWGTVPTSTDSTWNAVSCNWSANGYRLPTEAEWEYASRGGIHWADNYIYSGSDSADQVAWLFNNSGSTSHPIGTKSPNQLGIYDMSGNVWEWCWDWYVWNYYTICENLGVVTDPYGPTSGSSRVMRGGYWYNISYYCRVAFRNNTDPYQGRSFRVARTP